MYRIPTACLVIGDGVPRIHHSDGIPVYQVIESDRGIPILMKDRTIKNLLAYPSTWVAPGAYNHEHWLHAEQPEAFFNLVLEPNSTLEFHARIVHMDPGHIGFDMGHLEQEQLTPLVKLLAAGLDASVIKEELALLARLNS